MEAKITLSTMRFYASHGCYATERLVGGRFTIDLSYTYDASAVFNSDNVLDSVNYLDVYSCISEEVMVASHTIEHVARRVVAVLFSRFAIMRSVDIRLCKVSPPLGGDIGSVCVTLCVSRD